MRIIIGFAILLVLPTAALADGTQGSPNSDWTHNAIPAATAGSDASFDKRLPPVLPGETVTDSGRKLKVWSTSGPVPVSSPPEPWRNDSNLTVGESGAGVSVIVDREHNDRKGR